jgi:MIP family channel proteins
VNTRKLIAEAVGTFILVGLGSMAIISSTLTDNPALVVVPIGFGLALMAAIAVSGHVSGGHFNPAVTLAAVLDKRISAMDAVGYVIAQVVGAIAASGFILLIANQGVVSETRNVPGLADVPAFTVEVLLTAVFVAVILTVTKKAADYAITVIPLTLLMIHAVGIPFTGASVNPARSLGPALVSANFDSLWIYLTAPFVGAVVGWLVYRVLATED